MFGIFCLDCLFVYTGFLFLNYGEYTTVALDFLVSILFTVLLIMMYLKYRKKHPKVRGQD